VSRDSSPRRAVIFVSLVTASSLLGDQMLYAVLPSYYGELGLQPYQVGILLSANRIVRLLSNHFAERACHLWSPGRLLAISLVIGGCLNAVYGLFAAFPILLGARILWGICWSFIRQIGMMTVVEHAADQHLGRYMGYYAGISRMGSISGNLLGAMAHDLIGFTATLLIFAAASLVMVPLGPAARDVSRSESDRQPRNYGRQRPDKALLLCGFVSGSVGQGLLASTLGAVIATRQPDGIDFHGISLGVATLTGLLLSSRWLTDLSAPLFGMSIDRWGPRWTATVYFLVGALALVLASASVGVAGLVLSILLFYACAAGVGIVLNSMAGSGGPRQIARYVTASDLGSSVGPNLGWLVLQAGVAVHGVFLIGAGLYVVAGVVAGTAIASNILSTEPEVK
jgi:predicted MFS family arabinose efflux permease